MRKAADLIRTIGDGVRPRGVDVSGISVSLDLDDDDDAITEVRRDPARRAQGTTPPLGMAALRQPQPPIDGPGTYSLRPTSLGDTVPRQRPRDGSG